jgi:hypothetical protein
MVGTFISQTATIAFANGTTLNGRAIALGAGAVTLDNNTFTTPVCVVPTPTAVPSVRGLPDTGAAPIGNGRFPWSLVIIGGVSAVALAVGIQAYRRTHLPKQ